MMQLGLFQDWSDAEEVPRCQETRAFVEDAIGLALARIWTPSVPEGNAAFDRFGLFVEDVPRTQAECLRADERVSPATMLALRG